MAERKDLQRIEAVRQIVTRPMLALYSPPNHLRYDREAQAEALIAYEEALFRFDRPALEQGWRKVVAENTYWSWPNPGTIAAACKKFTPAPSRENGEGQRQTKALEMAEAYAARYMKKSEVARQAKREGWSGWLRDWVHEAAWVQAQLLCGVQNIAFSAVTLLPGQTFRSADEAFEAYRQTIGEVQDRGEIRVRVPRQVIAQRKEQARQSETCGKGYAR